MKGRGIGLRLLASAVIAGAVQAGAAIGAMRALEARPGHTGVHGKDPLRNARRMHEHKSRLHAAVAKRAKRQERNLRWHARGAYGRR